MNQMVNELLQYYRDRRRNVNWIFPRISDVLQHKQSLCVIFNQNMFKKISENMVFYHLLLHPGLANLSIKRVHFDGMFARTSKPYK